MDHADHRRCPESRWCRPGPTAFCRTRTMPWSPARSRCCRWCLHLPWIAAIFTVLNAAVLAIRIRAENRALAASRAASCRDIMSAPDRDAIEPGAAIWLGFILMCLGMFMAILDIQVVATSLPTIQHALAISPDAMSWIQTAYLIAEIIAIPLTGWLTRVLTLAMAVRRRRSALFTLASIGCAFSGGFAMLVGFRVVAGLCRRHADPGGVLRGVPAVSAAAASGRHHHGRHHGGAGADHRARGRRLDHRDLFLALAVPDQRHPRHRSPPPPRPCCCRATRANLADLATLDVRLAGADGDRAGEPGDRAEAGAATWLAVAVLRPAAAVGSAVAARRLPCER